MEDLGVPCIQKEVLGKVEPYFHSPRSENEFSLIPIVCREFRLVVDVVKT